MIVVFFLIAFVAAVFWISRRNLKKDSGMSNSHIEIHDENTNDEYEIVTGSEDLGGAEDATEDDFFTDETQPDDGLSTTQETYDFTLFPQNEDTATENRIIRGMKPGEKYTLADMLVSFDIPSDLTPHRLSAYMSQLGADGTGDVDQVYQGGKTCYTLSKQGEAKHRSLPIDSARKKRENEAVKEEILQSMNPEEPYTTFEILLLLTGPNAYTTPFQLNSILSELCKENPKEFSRAEENGCTYYYLSREAIEYQGKHVKVSEPDKSDSSYEEDEMVKTGILINMESGVKYVIADILCGFGCVPRNMSTSHVRTLLRQMCRRDDRLVNRYDENDKTYFAITEKGERLKKILLTDGAREKVREYVDALNEAAPQPRPAPFTPVYPDFQSQNKERNDFMSSFEQAGLNPFDTDNEDPMEDASHYNYYQNGMTDHNTFVGTCKLCGATWEFENYEVIPVPYPHGTCPNCKQWVAVF